MGDHYGNLGFQVSKGGTVWSINDGLSRNLRKPAGNLRGRFPDFEKKNPETYRKPAGNLPRRFPTGFRQVSGGFQSFPDNPSLTDHTVPLDCWFKAKESCFLWFSVYVLKWHYTLDISAEDLSWSIIILELVIVGNHFIFGAIIWFIATWYVWSYLDGV